MLLDRAEREKSGSPYSLFKSLNTIVGLALLMVKVIVVVCALYWSSATCVAVRIVVPAPAILITSPFIVATEVSATL